MKPSRPPIGMSTWSGSSACRFFPAELEGDKQQLQWPGASQWWGGGKERGKEKGKGGGGFKGCG